MPTYIKIALIIGSFWSSSSLSLADNCSYITLSNQVARKNHLRIAANNLANSNTIGFEADGILLKNIDNTKTKRASSFVYLNGTYRSESAGPLNITHRNLDLAIIGEGYFKILTPQGNRYTLSGALQISNDYVVVDSRGLAYASQSNLPIILPPGSSKITFSKDGVIYLDDQEIDTIGVFNFPEQNQLVKEGNNLYSSQVNDILLDEATIVSGALRGSNVSSAKAMADMIELQRSFSVTTNLMSEINDLEKTIITKIAK